MKTKLFSLLLCWFCAVLAADEPVSLKKQIQDANFGGPPVNLISSQKQLDSLFLTEKDKKRAISEILDIQKNATEILLHDAEAAKSLYDRLPKSQKLLPALNSQERRDLDRDLLFATRDAAVPMKGDLKLMKSALLSRQQRLLEAAKQQSSGKNFRPPPRLDINYFQGQMCYLTGALNLQRIHSDNPITGVFTVEIALQKTPGPYISGVSQFDHSFYHLVGWPSGSLSPRAPKDYEAPYKKVDTDSVVIVGDTANINSIQGTVLLFVSSLEDARHEVAALMQDSKDISNSVPETKNAK